MIGIFSDVHSNHDALWAVYKQLRHKLKVRDYWFLGDVIGYGPAPHQTITLLKNMKPKIWLAGNHDWYIAPEDKDEPRGKSRLRGSHLINDTHAGGPRPDAYKVDLQHRDVLDDNELLYIAGLPTHIPYKAHIYVAHAVYSVVNDLHVQLEYTVKKPKDFDVIFNNPEAPWHKVASHLPYIHVGGHSHITSFWKRPLAGGNWEMVSHEPIRYGEPYVFEAGYFYYVNPGSVGFPRYPEQPNPAFAVFDEKAMTITFHLLTEGCYNSETVRQQMKAQGYAESIYSEKQFFQCVLDDCE